MLTKMFHIEEHHRRNKGLVIYISTILFTILDKSVGCYNGHTDFKLVYIFFKEILFNFCKM